MLSGIIKFTVSAPKIMNIKTVICILAETGREWMPIAAKNMKIILEENILAVRKIE